MTVIQKLAVAEAEAWLGTPYRHQACKRGVGCDCLGLVRGIWCAVYGTMPPLNISYAADWAEHGGEERLLKAAEHHCGPSLPSHDMLPGDLLLFRWRPQFPAKHIGVLTGPDHFIHAYEKTGVIRSALVPGWRRKIAGVYRLPAHT